MQKIEVVVGAGAFNGIHEALRNATAKVGPFRASELRIYDPSAPANACYRGVKYATGRDCVKLEWTVSHQEVEATVDAIRAALDEFGLGSAEVVVQGVNGSMRHLKPSVGSRLRLVR